MSAQNTPMDAPLRELKEAMVGTGKKRKSRRRTSATKPTTRGARQRKTPKVTDMCHLDTSLMPTGLKLEEFDDYINIPSTNLNREKSAALTTVLGEVINIKRAVDFATYPDLLPNQMMVSKLSPATVRRSCAKQIDLVNYWAFVGYLVAERFDQDEELMRLVTTTDKPLISVSVTRGRTFRGNAVTLTPVASDKMYIGVVRVIATALKATVDSTVDERSIALVDAIKSLKVNAELSAFHGINIETDFM